MNIANISEGQIIKNYKALCTELGIEVKKGGSRKLQLQDLERYFKYHKDGHSFIITEIYKEPVEKIDGRGKSEGSRNNNCVYSAEIQSLVADTLAKSPRKEFSLSRNQLLLMLNMINENFKICGQRVDELSDYTSIDKRVIWDFYNTSNSSFANAVDRALATLEKRRAVYSRKILKVYDQTIKAHRDCTLEEEAMIQNIYEAKILKEYPDYDEVNKIRMSKYWTEFRDKVQAKLREETNFKFYYHAYFISINKDYIGEERDKLKDLMIDGSERQLHKDTLNNKVKSQLSKSADVRHDNATKVSNIQKARTRFDCGYPSEINKLIELLIDDDQESINNLFNKAKEENTEDIQTQLALMDEVLFG